MTDQHPTTPQANDVYTAQHAAAPARGHWRAVTIARAGGFQAYRRKWTFLFADEADCFPDCGLSQQGARDELQHIERSL